MPLICYFLHAASRVCLGITLCAVSLQALASTTPGVNYRKVTTANQQLVHILEVDPKVIEIKLVRAKDFAASRETVIAFAKHYNAIAGINGGFFRITDNGEGLPAGLLKIQNKLYGIAYKARGALGWDPQTNFSLFDRMQSKTTIQSGQYTFPINGMNSKLSQSSAVLYSDNYDKTTLAFATNAIHFIINNQQISAIHLDNSVQIPQHGYIYSVGAKLGKNLPALEIGDQMQIQAKLLPVLAPATAKTWEQLPNIISGTPLLLKDGKQITDYRNEGLSERFFSNPYARTAIGVLANNHWLLAVVETDLSRGAYGLNIPELATVMQDLGCIHALNLDGGGSSTMYYNNKLLNRPENDEDESLRFIHARKVTDAILLLPRQEFK